MPLGIDESMITEDCDDQSSLKSSDGPGSNRVKFLYGYGGRILPRPGDGKLRYVGGETRVMAVDRNISFADLMVKMTEVLDSSVVLKCQLPSEDLDALVSIKSDEDLENMLEEYEKLGVKEGFKVRAFLFPNPSLKPPVVASQFVAQEKRILGIRYSPCDPSTRGLYPNQQLTDETASMAGRPRRWSAAVPEMQHNNPVRYAKRSATQMYDMVKMPPQQHSAGRRGGAAAAVPANAYMDDRQFLRVDHSRCARLIYSGDNYHCTSASRHPPATQVRFPAKATLIPQQYSTKTEYNPYYNGGLERFPAYQQLLVQP